MDAGLGDRFVLEIPAEPAHAITARMFAAAIARHVRCSEETIQDVRLAVSEACRLGIGTGAPGGTLRVSAISEGPRLAFEVLGDAPAGADPAGGDPIGPQDVIGALFSDARIEPANGAGVRIAFSLEVGA